MRYWGSMKNFIKILGAMLAAFCTNTAAHAAVAFPTITVGMNQANTPQEFTQGVQILILLTILTLAPSIFIMCTAFIRIIIVLALTRQAIGTSTLPPNQVLAGLALLLTFFVMAPTFNKMNETAIQPYMKNQITQQAALDKAGISYKVIDAEENPSLAIKYGIMQAPTLVVSANGVDNVLVGLGKIRGYISEAV